MSDKKKILIIQPIHNAGIDLIKNNPNYDYEIIENIDDKDIKQKILECDGLSIRTANLSSELINISKKLKIISRHGVCLLYTSPSPRDRQKSRMPSSA